MLRIGLNASCRHFFILLVKISGSYLAPITSYESRMLSNMWTLAQIE